MGLLGVGLVSLFVLRSMIRSATPPVTSDAAQALPELAQVSDEPMDEEEAEAMLHRRAPSTGATLQEELILMVRDDPDAAANVLRTWIGDAA
jgi:flagellar M-ring protein FliF